MAASDPDRRGPLTETRQAGSEPATKVVRTYK
jgi:hypothetical protein